MARKLYPMPIEPIIRHPAFIAMPAAGAGMLFRLVAFYWETDCAPLPKADHDLRAISRAHLATWKDWKESVLTVFRAVEPELAAYHTYRKERRGHLKELSRRGGDARAATEARKRLAKSSPPLAHDPTAIGIVPKREPVPPRPAAPDARPKRPVRVDTLTVR